MIAYYLLVSITKHTYFQNNLHKKVKGAPSSDKFTHYKRVNLTPTVSFLKVILCTHRCRFKEMTKRVNYVVRIKLSRWRMFPNIAEIYQVL